MNRALAVFGIAAVFIMTAAMLAATEVYLWDYPNWAWVLIGSASIGLGLNALMRPQHALSPTAIVAAVIIGVALGWPVTVGGQIWKPAWLGLGVAMTVLGCWLLRQFSVAFRNS